VLNWQNRNKAALQSYWALDKSGGIGHQGRDRETVKTGR
jgi:hypothetical protein